MLWVSGFGRGCLATPNWVGCIFEEVTECYGSLSAFFGFVAVQSDACWVGWQQWVDPHSWNHCEPRVSAISGVRCELNLR